jgi:hypothetical protein
MMFFRRRVLTVYGILLNTVNLDGSQWPIKLFSISLKKIIDILYDMNFQSNSEFCKIYIHYNGIQD